MAANFAVMIVLARLIGPEGFGLVAYAAIFVVFLVNFLNFGLGEAIIQREDVEDLHMHTAFWAVLVIGLLLTVVAQGLAYAAGAVLDKPLLTPVMQALSISIIIGAFRTVPDAVLRRNMQFKSFALRDLASALIAGAAGVALALLGAGVWSLVAQRVCANLIRMVLLWHASRYRPARQFSFTHLKHLAAFGVNIFGVRLVSFFSQYADSLLIGYYLGDAFLGYYTISMRIIRLMLGLLVQTFNRVALSAFSRIQSDLDRVRRAVYSATDASAAAGFPAFLGVAALAPELIEIMAGPEWDTAVPVLRILCFFGLLACAFSANNSVMQGLGKPSWTLLLRVINLVIGVIGFFLVMLWGMGRLDMTDLLIAVAGVFTGRVYLLAPVQVALMRRLTKMQLSTYFRQFVGPLVAALVSMGAALAIRSRLVGSMTPHAIVAIVLPIMVVIYYALVYPMSPFVRRQSAGLLRMARNRLGGAAE